MPGTNLECLRQILGDDLVDHIITPMLLPSRKIARQNFRKHVLPIIRNQNYMLSKILWQRACKNLMLSVQSKCISCRIAQSLFCSCDLDAGCSCRCVCQKCRRSTSKYRAKAFRKEQADRFIHRFRRLRVLIME